jgi:glycosyltransferase involved in cell wall biosynthesis
MGKKFLLVKSYQKLHKSIIMKLLIISQTEHYFKDGRIVGWGPTVNEVNHLLKIFNEIYHIGVIYKDKVAPQSSIHYISKKIKFIGLKPSGGKSFFEKIDILFNAPQTLLKVHKILKKVDVFQFRSPVGIGTYLIPYLSIFNKKPGWFKYAGNWIEKKPPLGYKIQRNFLKNFQSRTVTINGRWDDDYAHLLSFENPCLDTNDRLVGLNILNKKSYNNPLTICFAGRFGESKGEDKIIESLKNFPNQRMFKEVHFIGDGNNFPNLIKSSKKVNIPIKFHGFVNREKVFKIFMSSDFILLPSKNSEGFPKVIAEASNFGCIPIVSNVSSIPQYIKNNYNGFLWDTEKENFFTFFNRFFLNIDNDKLKEIARNSHNLVSSFTYEYYNKRIVDEIIK